MRAAALLLAVATTAGAQHSYNPSGSFDPAVPTPRAVLGYEIGERFTPHHMIARYAERVAAASRRIRVDTVARTFEGREALLIVATSESNHARMTQIRDDARLIGAGRGDAAVVARMPAVAWLGYTIHGGEASGTEAALALLYQLAAGRDEETRNILDSVVVLIDPVQNPDGHERHVQDVTRTRGAHGVPTTPGAMVHQGNWPGPRTSHYYFDLNRDWFLHSHPETRGRVGTFTSWFPHVAVDLHEMGSNSTYFFAPPMEPVNKNVHANVIEWWDIYAAANAAAFDRHGWSYFRREGYDEFYPGYGVSWPILTGAVGMTYEQASSGGGAIRRGDGTILTLHDAAWHHYTAAWATLATTAARARQRVRDYAAFRASAITDAAAAPMRSVVFERDGQGRADSLAARLAANGIVVRHVASALDLPAAVPYGESSARVVRITSGAYIVDFAQPSGRLARALLEPDAQLDSSFIREELESRRTDQPSRFYDLTAWSLPYTFRLRSWWTRGAIPGGEVVSAPDAARRPAVAPAAAGSYGFAFEPGSESSLRLLSALLADSMRVWYAPKMFRAGAQRFPHGAFIVRTASNRGDVAARVNRLAAVAGARVVGLASSMVDEGTDLGSNSVIPVRVPRVALVGGAPIFGNSFGFAWYALEQRLAFPVTTVAATALSAGMLRNFDVVIVPSVGAAAFDNVLGANGRSALGAWVRAGGVLITLDGATSWLAREQSGLTRVRLRQDSTRADSAAGAPLPAFVPGAILRAHGDTLSPLLAGVRSGDIPVLMFSDRILSTPRDLRAGEAVIRYAELPRLRLAGYLWPEVPARVAGTPYLWTEQVGQGRVIAFAGDPNFRDMWRGLLPIFANAVLLGGSF